MTNELAISEALMPASPKVKDSPAQKQEESFRIQGANNKENEPAKIAHCSFVPVVQEDVSDSDDDLVPKLSQVKRS